MITNSFLSARQAGQEQGKKWAGLRAPQAHEVRWLYIDFNSYFASIEQVLNPKLIGKPIAVVPVMTEATAAIAASHAAKKYGIKTGTPIYEAKQKCPELICILAKHDMYVRYHHHLIALIGRAAPINAICSIDEIAIRLMNNEATSACAEQIARDIKALLAEEFGAAITCSIGIAPNRYLAKIAADMQKPDGLTIITPQDIPDKLTPLALTDFPGIGENMYRRLTSKGLYTVHDLYQHAPKHLRALWGNLWGEKIYYLIRGYEMAEEKSPPRRMIGHSHVLPPHLRPMADARLVMRRLGLKCASRLRRYAQKSQHIHLAARSTCGHRFYHHYKCHEPIDDSHAVLKILDELWQTMRDHFKKMRLNPNIISIKKISVSLTDLHDQDDFIQPDLFHQNITTHRQTVKNEKLSSAMDKLNKKYGRDTIILGAAPKDTKSFAGTKIAFTRIPDQEEFFE